LQGAVRLPTLTAVKSGQAWIIAMCVPALLLWATAGYMTGAGCYAWTMNCFSLEAVDPTSRMLLFAAAFLPFAAPAYLPVLAAGVAAARRGRGGILAWLVCAPLAYALLVHASCLLFASWVLPDRRVTPSFALDLGVFAAGCAYAALAWLTIDRWKLFEPRPDPWRQRALSNRAG
jgi:hypothetical protein